jgi:acyl transferase domain-containing protein
MNPNCRINKSALSQPLSTALQIGLVNLIRRMGVQPDSVVGHSSGEIAAAYAAGAITARSAITIAYYRGIVTESMDGKGAMLAVGVGRNEIAPYLSDNVFMACENSPQNVTLSGDLNAIHEVSERIQEDLPETLCRLLRVQTAYHSRTSKFP